MNDAATVELPDDPTLLKRIILEREQLIVERDALIVGRDAIIEQIKREAADCIEAMQLRHKAEMDAILRRFYGPRSEKFDPTELLLFGQNIAEQIPVDPQVVEAESGQKLSTRRINHKHGRRRTSTTTPPSGRSSPWPSAERTGCSPATIKPANPTLVSGA